MADLARKWPGLLDVSLPAWAGEELLDLYVDWEHRRWQVDRYQPEIRDGCRCAINYIDHLLRELNPAIVLTTNKIDPPNCFAYRSEEHTSELQSLMRISYAVFCLKKKRRI